MSLKKIGLISGMVGVLFLGACSNTDNKVSTEVEAFSIGDKNISEALVFNSLKDLTGDEGLQQAIGQLVLLDKYDVSKSEIKDRVEVIESDYESAEDFENALADMGVSKEHFEKQVSIEIAHDKALTERNKVTEEAIKKRYEETKLIKKAISYETTDKESADSLEKIMKDNKTLSEIKELSGDSAYSIEEVTLSVTTLPEELKGALDLKVGEVGRYELEGQISIFKVVEDIELVYDDVKEDIKSEMMYEGLESFGDVFEYLVEKHKVELKGEYKDLLKK